MVAPVTVRALTPVKITHVTYKVEHVWIVNMKYMVTTATCRVQATVKTTHVTCRLEHALHVNLDGLECIVEQVRIQQETNVNE